MNWIGQHIYDLISRFRDDVYLEDISSGTIASGGNLGLDSNNKIVKATVASGDITAVNITTDSGGGSKAAVASGDADFSILGNHGVGVTNSGATINITAVEEEIDHDSLLNFAANEHFTQANITTVGTIGTGVWNGTKITDIYTNSSGKRYGSTIKILPSDFMINDDAASPLSFKDGSNSGVHVNDAANEVVAFVTIPEGMMATHVDVYGTHNKTLKVWAPDLNASFDFTGSTLGTGAMNTQLDITDTNATATNYLAIQLTLTATSQRIWGGIVTIAPQ